MIGLLPLLLVAVIAGVVVVATHHGQRTPPLALTRAGAPGNVAAGPSSATSSPAPAAAPSQATTPLQAALRRWQAAALVTPEQARAIEEYELALMVQPALSPPARRRRVPLVAEALGYLGGTLGLVGLTLLIARYWQDMPTAGRLGLTGGAALLLAVGGYLVHESTDPAFMRLRWFMWTISAAAGGLFAGVLAHSGFGATAASTIALVVACEVMVHNGIFWAGRFRPVQQALTLTAAMVAIGTLATQWLAAGPTGLAVWVAGAILLLIGAREMLSVPPLTAGIGGTATLVGAAVISNEWQGPGLVFLLLTAAGLLAIATAPVGSATGATRVVLTVVGGLGMLQATPVTVGYFADRAGVVTGLVVWAVGGCMLLLAARKAVRTPIVVEIAGGVALVAGAAVMGVQSVAVATTVGIVTAVGLIGLGTIPGRVLLSLFGSLGLLINVPWAINHFFPGEGRAPLLIFASGTIIVAAAVWLARMGGRFRRELRH